MRQNACELSHDDYSTCYDTAAFDFSTSLSHTRKYELYRSQKGSEKSCAEDETETDAFWGFDGAVFGDGGNKTKCRWTASAKTRRFMKEVGPNDLQLVNTTIAAVRNSSDAEFEYDYAFEICHQVGAAPVCAHTPVPRSSPARMAPSLSIAPTASVQRAHLSLALALIDGRWARARPARASASQRTRSSPWATRTRRPPSTSSSTWSPAPTASPPRTSR